MVVLFDFVASGIVTNLFPTMAVILGYPDVNSLLLVICPCIPVVIISFCNARHAVTTEERYIYIMLTLFCADNAFVSTATTASIVISFCNTYSYWFLLRLRVGRHRPYYGSKVMFK